MLGRPRIELQDNFFDAGGTSLKAVQVLAMIRKELDRELSIVTIFECPTVAMLAAKLSDHPAPPIRSETAASRGHRRRVALAREVA
ncbi:Dimodular nonribosomal peptide synthase [compost metagenome]